MLLHVGFVTLVVSEVRLITVRPSKTAFGTTDATTRTAGRGRSRGSGSRCRSAAGGGRRSISSTGRGRGRGRGKARARGGGRRRAILATFAINGTSPLLCERLVSAHTISTMMSGKSSYRLCAERASHDGQRSKSKQIENLGRHFGREGGEK